MKSIETLDPVMIIGAGVMGSGIAQVAAHRGYRREDRTRIHAGKTRCPG
jgi:3-hydroxyacyl-CoA dehydrogenase